MATQGLAISWENKVLDLMFGGQSFSVPTILYAGLYLVSPSQTSAGTEVSFAGSYGRVAIDNDLTSFPSAGNGTKTNGIDISFAQATADWGTVVAIAFKDAPTGGNLYAFGQLSRSINIVIGNQRVFPAGSLTLNCV